MIDWAGENFWGSRELNARGFGVGWCRDWHVEKEGVAGLDFFLLLGEFNTAF